MADLTEHQKLEIVEALAGFQSPSAIITYFRSAHALDLTRLLTGTVSNARVSRTGFVERVISSS